MRLRAAVRRAAGALALALAVASVGWSSAVVGAEIPVEPGGGRLAAAVAAAAPGDVLRLEAGDHRGGLTIGKSLTVAGLEGARIVGNGSGHAIVLDAPSIRIEGVTVTGSGLKLESEDSGIFVTERATGAVVADNRLEDNLIGVYLKGPTDAQVRGNVILGRRDLRMNERGNGVQIWRAPGSVVDGNDIRYGRDGIFVTTSKKNAFRNNSFRDLRFAVHYMYTNQGEVTGNRSQGNHAGYAIMYSNRVTLAGNSSEGDRDHGILMNYANNAAITGNRVSGGPHKCVFIYNASKNVFRGNRFEGCEIGIHFTGGSERNAIGGNAFIANRTQVKYVGTREVEWSQEGRGNYWSDNLGFDLDGDNIADEPYRPNDLVDQIVWRYPLAKLLLNSPATQILRWAQSAFPALYPGGVTDSFPLMAAPAAGRPGEGG
jgi:nitrous oxidase accessory protein